MKPAALIYGKQPHHLDHLAPLAWFLKIPLIVTEPELEGLCHTFYPEVIVHSVENIAVGEFCVSHFDTIISSLPQDLLNLILFIPEALHQKKLQSIWCPHGNSDKGHHSYFMEGLYKERITLVYGDKMIDFLKEKGAHAQLEKIIFLGNYRFEYYQKHASFLDRLLQKELRKKLPTNQRTLLYAPTWEDDEKSSSLLEVFPFLIRQLPDHWNLIIKPHPNQKFSLEEQKPNLYLLENFPPIYPLLNLVDAYLGDMSSIGYDFLIFKKPMFFVNPKERNPQTDRGLFLTQCGPLIPPKDFNKIFAIIEETDPSSFVKIQEKVYDYTFAKEGKIHELFC